MPRLLDYFWTFFSTFLSTVLAFGPVSTHAPREACRRLFAAPRGIRVSRPTEAELAKMQVKTWSTWGCPPSRFPWSYADTETAYLIKGKVVVTPDDKALDAVTLMPGDLAVFPQGLACTWDVKEELDKHYKFD